jgi:hypothetical protein
VVVFDLAASFAMLSMAGPRRRPNASPPVTARKSAADHD